MFSLLDQNLQSPVVIEHQSDYEVGTFVEDNKDVLLETVKERGALLFRGFEVSTPAEFERFLSPLFNKFENEYGDLPKEKSGSNIYKSTPYPENMIIRFHNESSHMNSWPSLQGFFCHTVAQEGGATPIVDCREALKRLPNAIYNEIKNKGIMYIRNFHSNLDVSWQDFFHTQDIEVVKQKCEEQGIEFEMCPGGIIQTRSYSPGILEHPETGQEALFNQIQLHHPRYLDSQTREVMESLFGDKYMPRNVKFGDGTDIPEEYLAELDKIYDELSFRFTWQKGDMLFLDNLSIAHGRDTYRGERKVCVVLGDMMKSNSPIKSEC